MCLRRATNDDWIVLTKLHPPALWYGFVAETSFMMLGIGGAYRAEDGRWWATFKRLPGVRHTLTAHKAARLTLAVAGDMGISLNAVADEEITGSVAWLERLGFRATGETYLDRTVWTWALN